MALKENDCADPQQVQWVIMETRNDICDDFLLESSESSIEDSENSAGTSSIDMVEDDASSSYGPLYELSELMAQLPIKRRGLSKYYQGKSQSFGHLGTVNSHKDLAKKESSYNSRMKSCQSFGGGFSRISSFGPKATITKKSSRMTILSSSLIDTNTLVGICRFPTTLEKKF